ncbi:cytochrome D ubiquinol oxidase subunit I [Aneurinibacillus migulanus]|uniref:Cytochrome D ubiquinol oxidase subunit I n=1 Tax=Aneurinibacillus migulanus TaxID=47500 RepID=A0A0D1VZV9_ANEMI|nr:cytochrome ubiquinol oxidase subunit I [Aneurinibacillus migulanus]KIV51735.1 cytochrome D ubiquinol oxidase subunit I [Aneurinibacillus migulanus]KIV54564.1 cytochrome D ubiquinol oxidase subunit I [Aneurinibacillus migulanus]KON97851.1 cytochrome D ubiquinol oxidase subunit I [Aneurinibacillus migulanus]KPD08039.1 cytochrome D ubiquinol oxidase subunit I [Aneurinibacillus migulanus]MCP1353995.1 cytochrome ubiquinol oxidase subunit I [Aneurinibacillus migulanus]
MFTYDAVLYSRILTEVTLAFHILFATIGVGVPLLIALAQWIGIKKNDPHYILLARRWTRGFVITVAVGVVTGTAIGLQLSLLWPNFMELAGQVISLPLFLETFAFFFEAIFLGIYLYTWDRFKNQMKHFLLLIPVVIGSSMSALFITIVNAFMNTPQGFELKDGVIVSIQPLVAMFNPAMPTKVGHVLASAYMTSAFVLASIAAYRILRGSTHVYHKKALHITLVSALVFSLATAIIGDFSGKFLAEYQPEKLAAAEWHFETSEKVPLVLFGTLDENNEVKNGITIPYGLSILAHNNPNAEVIGLNEFPADELPPLYIHYLFDLMVSIGVLLTVVAFIYVILHKRKKSTPYRKPLLVTVALSGPLALLAIEFGWIFAEVGRQPWILRGYMKTSAGATTADYVDILLICFIILYALLAIVSTIVLRKMFKNNPVEQEVERMNSTREVDL